MTTRSGGVRLRLLIGASAAVLVAAACGGSPTATTAPASDARLPRRPTSRRPARARERRRPARSTCSTRTTRRPTGADGGHRDRRRLAGGDPVQPVLPDPGHRGQRRVRGVGDPRDVHPRLQVRAGPRGRDPDPRERRRQGPGRQRRRDDRHLEAARRPQVVRRHRPDLRRLQVRVGMGHGPGQRGRHHVGLRGHDGLGLPVRDRHGPPLREHLRGLHHDGGRARCPGTSCRRSRSPTRSRAGLPAGRGRPDCRPAARSSSSP